MSSTLSLSFRKKPSTLMNYVKILMPKRKVAYKDGPLPAIHGRWDNIIPDCDNLRRYREACGLKNDNRLPILYPHVLASPVYMNLLSHREFPIPLIGSLHLRNHIIQHRTIHDGEAFDLDVMIGEKRFVKQGLEFDFKIMLSAKGERLWESITTWIRRGKSGEKYTQSPYAAIIRPIPDGSRHAESYIHRDIGKKFARITGDYNPIHISKTLAPFFGLKRDVAHAMWACADAINRLPSIDENAPRRIDLAFKGPLYIDSPCTITIKKHANGFRFDTYCGDNPRPSIQGQVRNIQTGKYLY